MHETLWRSNRHDDNAFFSADRQLLETVYYILCFINKKLYYHITGDSLEKRQVCKMLGFRRITCLT